jgi:hypothetical protein
MTGIWTVQLQRRRGIILLASDCLARIPGWLDGVLRCPVEEGPVAARRL